MPLPHPPSTFVTSRGVRFTRTPDMDNIYKLDSAVIPMLAAMRRHGMLIDREGLAQLGAYCAGHKEELTDEVQRLTGKRINVGSGDQVAALLFDPEFKGGLGISTRGLDRTEKDTRWSTGGDSLEAIKHRHPVIPIVLEYRQTDKILGTYVNGVDKFISDDNLLHPNIKHTFVETGRFSTEEPNLMAIPVRSELGKEVRKRFVARPGYKLVTSDLSQVELRWTGIQSNCSTMVQAYTTGDDLHWLTAEKVFRQPRDKLKKSVHRAAAKIVNFSIVYETTAAGLLAQILAQGGDRNYWTEELCQEAINAYFVANPEVRALIELQHARALKYGMTWDWFGRIRLTPEVYSVHRWIRNQGLRSASNMPTQSVAVGTMKIVMADIWDWIESAGLYPEMVRPLLQIHDELLCEVREDFVEEYSETANMLIRSSIYDTPILMDGSTVSGESWGDLEK